MTYHHIYNRGAHKAPIFQDGNDYWRMLRLLYIANNTEAFNLKHMNNNEVFKYNRKGTLVDVVSYCLMPNHIHIAVGSKSDLEHDLGISKFMQKLCTGYTGYFNKKYDHVGTIWQGSYKEKIADDKSYINILTSYIHLNPYGIIEPDMTREERKNHPLEALAYSLLYEYSSLKDYVNLPEVKPRPQKAILCSEEMVKIRSEV